MSSIDFTNPRRWRLPAWRDAAASVPAALLITLLVWLLEALTGTWWQTNRFVEREHSRFAAAYDTAFGLLAQRLDQNEALLDGLVALLRSSRDQEFSELREYANEMLRR